ncbi:hypothetical protein, partial [Burkholderia multivorans]
MIVVLVVVNGRARGRAAAAHEFNLRARPRCCCKDLLSPYAFRNELFRPYAQARAMRAGAQKSPREGGLDERRARRGAP